MLDFVAKLMLLTVYLWSAILNKTINFKRVRGLIVEAHLPHPTLCLFAASALEVLASFAILFPGVVGRQAYVAAAVALAVYTMVAATLFHPFWARTGPERANFLVNFLKNIGLTGAFLLLISR